MKIWDMSKFTTIDSFFVNVNKSSVSAIIPEQSESASFVTLVEIHNVDVQLVSENLLYCRPPLALCCGPARSRSNSKLSLTRVPIHIHNRRVGPTIGSSSQVAERKCSV